MNDDSIDDATSTGHPDAIWSHEAGDQAAPLVVLVHGSMDRSAGMLRLSRRLDRRFRVVRYDRRGYGRSAPHAGPFDMDAQVADLVQLLAGREALVVGHSYGGNVALATAARHPDLVRGAAIYETPLSWAPWWPGSTAGERAVDEPARTDVAAERFMRRLLGDARWEGLPTGVRAQRRMEGAALVGELSDLRVNPPWHPDELTMPIVLGFGSEGAAHHRRGMTETAAMIPGAALVELPGRGHDAVLTDAGLFCGLIVERLLDIVGPPWGSTGR
jgi:pimeloyl-ACP methyl ester carboxylesterase